MAKWFAGKVALVTGAGSGIGRASALTLAAGPGALEGQLTIAQRAEALGVESLWAPDLKGMFTVMEDFARKVGM